MTAREPIALYQFNSVRERLGCSWRQIKQLIKVAIFPWPVFRFLQSQVGSEYRIGMRQKLILLYRLLRNATVAGSATTFYDHVTIVQGVLLVPAKIEGDVAEFGCYKGAATASLSLACALTGRRLKAFDSFEGLPEPNEKVTHLSTGAEVPYRAGQYLGTLDEVKRNVSRGGDLSVCEFVKGFFGQTLPSREATEQYVLIFEDADLPTSVRAVLEYAWPRLREYGLFFCHEARDKEVVQLFYDSTFWREKLNSEAPGFVGSGCGLPLDFRESQPMLGYAIKLPADSRAGRITSSVTGRERGYAPRLGTYEQPRCQSLLNKV